MRSDLEAPPSVERRAPSPPSDFGPRTSDLLSWTRLTVALAVRAIVSPSLARDLLRVAWRFRARHWYLHPPFLPLPSRAYVRWRMHTAYGDSLATPPVDDVVRYARWVARQR